MTRKKDDFHKPLSEKEREEVMMGDPDIACAIASKDSPHKKVDERTYDQKIEDMVNNVQV